MEWAIETWLMAVGLVQGWGWIGALLVLFASAGLILWGSELTGTSAGGVVHYRERRQYPDGPVTREETGRETWDARPALAESWIGRLGGSLLKLIGVLIMFVAIHAGGNLLLIWLASPS